MPISQTWDSLADWNLWVNESDPSGDQDDLIRVYDGQLKLPFNKIIVDAGTEIARWRFGQNQDASDDTGNNHTANLQSGASISEFGLNMPNRNAHAVVDELGDFAGLTAPYYVAMWYRSTITDYSSSPRYVMAGFTTGVGDGEIEYALGINTTPFESTENAVMGWVNHNSGIADVPPSSEDTDTSIDTKWHLAILYVDSTSKVWIDNDFTSDQQTASLTLDTIGGSPQFSIGS